MNAPIRKNSRPLCQWIPVFAGMTGFGKAKLAARAVVLILAAVLTPSQVAARQSTATLSAAASPAQAEQSSVTSTPLAKLVEEAEQKNPRILAAVRAWQASEQVPSQVSTLPDPQISVQQFAVGSPRPFAGFSNSDFAYIGFGVSEDFPYPGKLGLRGEMAKREAAASRHQADAVRRAVVEQLKSDYYQLSYYGKTLSILHRDERLLDQVEKIAEARYGVGQGNQQDVLKAQLERTKILGQIVQYRQQIGQLEAELKTLLNRPADSPDITPEDLTETSLPFTSDDLLGRVRTGNPQLNSEQEMVRRQSLQVELARKDYYPDFNVQYMWQHTGAPFRDYYVATFGVKLPIWRSRKQRPEVAQAVEELNSSRREYEADTQQLYSQVEDRYLAADADAKLLKIYREGLIPQATASFQAGLVAYETGRLDFESILSSFLDVLNLDTEYWRTLADHETALAQIERLTGVTLP